VAIKSSLVISLEYYGVKGLIALFSMLPRSWGYGATKILALLFYHLVKSRRKITIENLSYAFSDLGVEQIQGLSKEVYIELSKTLTDTLFLLSGRLEIDAIVENREEALAKLALLKSRYQNGFIFMGAHFSNWELPPLFASKHGFPMVVVGREGDNPLIDKEIILPFRSRYGNQTVYKRSAGIAMMRELKSGGAIGVLIDQKVNKANGFLVPFFGRDAFTTNSVAMMKLKSDPVVIPISMPRVSQGMYRLDIGDPVEYRADEVEEDEEKLKQMTQRYNLTLEAIIKEYPAQWFWMHDRWNLRE